MIDMNYYYYITSDRRIITAHHYKVVNTFYLYRYRSIYDLVVMEK